MWFNAQAALAEIEGAAMLPSKPMCNLPRVAHVAHVARPQASEPESPPREFRETEAFPYGFAIGETPRTWTGRVVSLADWRDFSDWEKHGPRGRLWNGISQRWE